MSDQVRDIQAEVAEQEALREHWHKRFEAESLSYEANIEAALKDFRAWVEREYKPALIAIDRRIAELQYDLKGKM